MTALADDRDLRSRPVAVVLAAGEGSRLHDGGLHVPKPIVRLAGVSLAEHTLGTFRDAGVDAFIVVLGHEADRVREHFESIARRHDVHVEFVYASNWRSGNGSSALAARELVGDRHFLLTMADHLLSPASVAAMCETAPATGEVVLAVDRDIQSIPDIDDLTKVRTCGDRVLAIGKKLNVWDAGDTGLFHASPILFDALERAGVEGHHALTDAVRYLADRQAVRVLDVTGNPWFDVDTQPMLEAAQRALVARISKGGEDGYISQYINRPVSRWLTGLLLRTPLSPNQVSIASFLIAIAGAICLARPEYTSWILGGLLIQLASIVDGCDGEVARLRHLATPRGGWFDTLLDRYADAAVVLAVTHAATQRSASAWIWPAGLAVLLAFVLVSYLKKEYRLRFGRPYPPTLVSRLTRRDLRIFVVAVGAVIGFPWFALLTVGVLSHLAIVWMSVAEFLKPGARVQEAPRGADRSRSR